MRAPTYGRVRAVTSRPSPFQNGPDSDWYVFDITGLKTVVCSALGVVQPC